MNLNPRSRVLIWARWAGLLSLLAALWLWRTAPAAPDRTYAAQSACLNLAMPAVIGPYQSLGPRQIRLMGGMDISVFYQDPGSRRRMELTYGLGSRATHPWLQSYRVRGDQVRWQSSQRLPMRAGHADWNVAVVDGARRRWLVASVQCWKGHCEGNPFRLWLASWWRMPATPVIQITVLAGASLRRRLPVTWYDNELRAFLRHFRLPPVLSCASAVHR